METIIVSIFVLGYLAITLEHSLKVDKLIPALAMMALMWAIISLAHLPVFDVNTELKELEPSHLDEILLHQFNWFEFHNDTITKKSNKRYEATGSASTKWSRVCSLRV